MTELKIIEQREVLGKDFKVYGDYENPLFLAKDKTIKAFIVTMDKKISYVSCHQEVIPETVGQFTGYYDINGIKIFEGDILETKGKFSARGLVHQDEDSWFGATDYLSSAVKWGKGEIIGNIHDNPELLKGER